MRCSSCNTNTPGKTLKSTDYRCPICGHQFVAIKTRDGVSDVTIRKTIEKVSDNGTLWYRPEHLAYQLWRRISGVNKWGRVGCLVIAAVLVVIGLLIWGFAKIWLPALVAVILAGIAIKIWFTPTFRDPFELVSRFEAANPPERRVPATEALIERERSREMLHAGMRGAGRILVCQNRHDAHFLIANDFHLQHACPVTGPDGKAVDGFPELEQRLARPAALDVFVLHDFTPSGFAFMRRVRQLPAVVKRKDPLTLIEMGFDDRHRPLFRHALLPLARISGANDPTVRAWKGGEGAQVTAMLPAVFLAAAGVSLADRAPIRVPVKEGDDGLDDDGESGDSE